MKNINININKIVSVNENKLKLLLNEIKNLNKYLFQ
jgi:hypothetical protein